jgi:hypothetical protein
MVTAFECSKCGRRFLPVEGGVCTFCGEVVCNLHLNVIAQGQERMLICVDCSAGHEADPGFVKLVGERPRSLSLNRRAKK